MSCYGKRPVPEEWRDREAETSISRTTDTKPLERFNYGRRSLGLMGLQRCRINELFPIRKQLPALMRNKLFKVRQFKSPYGTRFPLCPRRIGMALRLFPARYPM